MSPSRRQVLLTTGSFFLLPLLVGLKFQSKVIQETEPQAYTKEKKRMQVSLERTGGFTGIPMRITVNTETLSPEQVTQLHQLIEASDFFHLPHEILGAAQPDRFHYRVTVEENGRRHEVLVDEPVMPRHLKPLVDWLMQAMREQQRR